MRASRLLALALLPLLVGCITITNVELERRPSDAPQVAAEAAHPTLRTDAGVLEELSSSHHDAPTRADSGSPRNACCVDINRAPLEELHRIRHIGPVRAQEIVALRQRRPFASVAELRGVSGIGPARIRSIHAQNLACVQE
jgi:DNA uptake protein ComE-like DNA-binding protein